MDERMSILDVIRQTVKGGMNRLGNEFSAVTPEERAANMQRRPNMPGYSTPAGADSIAGRFAGQFPTQDDMQRHRGSPYTVPDHTRRLIMQDYGDGMDVPGYEREGLLPTDVIDKVLIEEHMRRRNRAMPGSPVDY